MENILESNKLIAEFMKLDIGHGDMVIDKWSETSKINSVWTKMRFHSDWNWLMEVAEKCFQTQNFIAGSDEDYFIANLNDALITINKDEVYKAVIKFIEWYNNQEYIAALEQDEQRYEDSLK